MQKRGNGWLVHALVILTYLLLALALTWPLAVHFSSHVPGDGADDPPLTWNLWWVSHSLLTLKANPFDCDYLFYPLGINLTFYTPTVLNGLLSIPLQATVGLIPASNILLLSSFVLGGYGTFLLILYLLKQKSEGADEQGSSNSVYYVAFTAGLLYAFTSSKLFYAALGQWNIASSQWIPFYILYLFKMADHPRRRRYALLAALFLLFQAYAEMIFASFLVLFTLLWIAWKLVTDRHAWHIVLPLAVTGLLSALGLIPVLAAMIPDMRAEGDILMEGGGFADVFSADLLGFLIPTMHHPLFSSLVERFSFDYTVGQHLYLGYVTLALAVVGVVWGWRRRSMKFWLLSALAFWLLTLGPALRVNGHDTGLPLPFALLAQMPFFKGNRYPSRYSVMLALSLAVLAGFGLAATLSWISKKRLSAAALGRLLRPAILLLLAALLLFEHLSVPLPLSDMRVPPVYQTIANMPGDWTLLDVPVAWRNGFRVTGTLDPIIMFEQYYQTIHGKRLIAGNISRNPLLKFQYFTEAPILNTLIALETGHQVDGAVVERDRALAAAVLRFFNVRAIIVHPAKAGADAVSYVETALPVRPLDLQGADQASTLAYAVDLPSWPEAWTVVPGDPVSRLSYAEGWGAAATETVWAQRPAVRLLVPSTGHSTPSAGSDIRLMTFRAYVPGEGQRLSLEINGQAAGKVEMTSGWQDYGLALPAGIMREGLNEVWLRFDRLYPVQQASLSPRLIGQTGVRAPVSLVVQSAGQEVGDFGLIYVDGEDVSLDERGYNVVVIHPVTGTVEQVAAFDTHLDEEASRALAAFLADVPAGHLVAVAAADEASRLLSSEAVEALHAIGAGGDLRDHFRWGHAIIGVKGAPPGTALEALDWMRPVTLVVGEGATEPRLAAAFPFITFGATANR